MGLGKAVAALGMLILIGGLWIKNNGVSAIGLLLVIASLFVGLPLRLSLQFMYDLLRYRSSM